MNHKEDLIAGRNAVIEALRAKKPIDKIFVLDGCQDGPIRTIVREAKKTDAILKFVDKERLNQLTNEHHQGVVAIVAAYEYGTIEDLFKRAEEKGEDPFFILLDGIEDPHNLGAIIRTANLAGAHGVIIPNASCSWNYTNCSKNICRCDQLYTSCESNKYWKNNG